MWSGAGDSRGARRFVALNGRFSRDEVQRDSEDDWRVSFLAFGLRWVMLRLAKTVLRLQEEPRVCNKRCGVGGANRRDTGPSPLLVSFAVLSYQVV
jgi:hypothetical protein